MALADSGELLSVSNIKHLQEKALLWKMVSKLGVLKIHIQENYVTPLYIFIIIL